MGRDGTGRGCARHASRWASCGSEATLTRTGRDTRSSQGWFLRRCREGRGGARRAGRWIYKTEEWGGKKETDGWMEESKRFTDGRRQDVSADVHVKATCADGPCVLTRPCPQQTPLMASLVEWFNWLHASLLCPGPVCILHTWCRLLRTH